MLIDKKNSKNRLKIEKVDYYVHDENIFKKSKDVIIISKSACYSDLLITKVFQPPN